MEGAEPAAGEDELEPAPPAARQVSPSPLEAPTGAAASALRGAAARASKGAAASTRLKLVADAVDDEDLFGAPAPAAASDIAKGPNKRKERKGHMTCIGCLTSKLVTDFDLSQKVCKECKRHLDRISGQCKRQGKLEWFAEQRRDPKKLVSMLAFYKKIADACASTDKPKFSIAVYQETHAAEQEVSYAGEGEMMWQEQALNV